MNERERMNHKCERCGKRKTKAIYCSPCWKIFKLYLGPKDPGEEERAALRMIE